MKFSIIQLSDMHFREDPTKNFISDRIEKLAGAIKHETIDVKYIFFVISGDIAFSGKIDQYEYAFTFLSGLLRNITEDENKGVNIVICPGNHDCDFSTDQTVRNILIDKVLSDNSFEDAVINSCITVQNNFFEFIKKTIPTKQLELNNDIFQKVLFTIDDKTIVFNLLNTAWISRLEEIQGKLIFPIEKIDQKIDCNKEEIVLSILHHPYSWFESNNSRRLKEKLESISDIILTGHEHENNEYLKTLHNGETIAYIEGGVLQDKTSDGSQFNIIKIDTEEKWLEISSYTWNEQRQIYLTEEIPQTRYFIRNQKRPNTGYLLQGSFEKEVNDIGIKYSHPLKETILLDDIYVYPHLRRINTANNQHFDKLIIRDSIPNYIADNHHVMIIGSEKSGKTSLAKVLFKHYFNSGYLPLLFEGSMLKNCDENRIETLIDRIFKQTYITPSSEEYFQLEKSKKVILIDDFQKSSLNQKKCEKIIGYLKNISGSIVIFGDDQLRYAGHQLYSEEKSLFSSFIGCEILGMGYVKRSELIRKWNMLGDTEDLFTSGNLSRKLIKDEKIVSALLGKNFIPAFPFFILVILQQIETGTPVNTSSGNYGYYYEALLTVTLSKIKIRNIQIDTLYSYLSELAYHFNKKKIRSMTYEELSSWNTEYCNKYKLPININQILEGLINVSVLSSDSRGYSFRYPYIFYYFVSRYFRDHIGEMEIKNQIQWMSERLHQTDSANIIIFLCHLSKDPFVLSTLLSKSRNLFKNYSEFKILSDTEFISGLIQEIPDLVLEGDPDKNHTKELEKRDDAEKLEQQVDEDNIIDDDGSDFDLEEIMQINVAVKNIQILGQLLKNFPGSWQGQQKFDLVQECYSLGLRVLKFFFTSLNQNQEEIIVKLAEILKEQYPEWENTKVSKNIELYIFSVLEGIAYAIIKHIADSVGHDTFSMTFDELLNSFPDNTSYSFIDLEVKLNYYQDFPDSQVFDLSKNVRKNSFASYLLRHFVWYYFYIFKTDFSFRQSICSRLKINGPSLLPSPNRP
ncbi:predicted phosphohydrolase [Longilinea arvoryzae]|uniref:Predicted phosphohydrolase n=1 Tax=Longilinea arvoryzae TaxID=360412 RepID=A0A0S7BFI5_9CHLR|nr:metallophosphoesterase [Longilinea arvoryzae]GAP14265.1 predicted phosphohydrolase [Longilinea arvoryzae]